MQTGKTKNRKKRTMALLKATEQDKKKTAGGIGKNGILLCPAKKSSGMRGTFRSSIQRHLKSETDIHANGAKEDYENHNRGKETNQDCPERHGRQSMVAGLLVQGVAAETGKEGNQVHIRAALLRAETQLAGGFARTPHPADKQTDRNTADRQDRKSVV